MNGGGSTATLEATEAGGEIAGLPNGLRREVFGFLPYWILSDAGAMEQMNYELVSTIAYFGVGARSDGTLDKGTPSAPSVGWAGWTSSAMTDVLNRAHSFGDRVVLTVTMMAWDPASWARMETLLTSPTARARLVGQIVDAVRLRGADGVNLDFELVPSSLRNEYSALTRELKAALVAAGVGSYLSVCVTGGAATWATGYDLAALTASGAADRLFVMGYDYSWSGSARAGGVAPIDSPYTLDVSSSLADFLEVVPGSRLIWGVPYYGRSWTTSTSTLNAPTTGASWSYYYTGHRSQAATYGRRWDDVGKVPWYRYWDAERGSWVQSYYDDAEALTYKYDLVNRYGLAGTGMWHLMMDAGRDELWKLISERFVTDTRPPSGGVSLLPETTDGLAVHVTWRAIDYQSYVDRYNVQVRDRFGGAWTSWLTGTTATDAWWVGREGRTYEFRIQAIDTRGNAQPWRTSPATPTSLTPGYFAANTSTLNVRSGAGTEYGLVDTLAVGERVLVVDGPVSASGYRWWQVQHGFAEWPSADYARIGWVVDGASGETYLVPAPAPNITRLDPFVEDYATSVRAFSPNGDGRTDGVSVTYSLDAAASAVRLDVVNDAGYLVRRISVGGQAAGPRRIDWDGQLASGGWAPAGRYVLRVVATDSSGTHVAPAAGWSWDIRSEWGVIADLTPPTVTGGEPGDGEAMLPASTRPWLVFSEPVSGVSATTVRLAERLGPTIGVDVAYDPAARRVTVTPDAALPTGRSYRLDLLTGITDTAGNPVAAASYQFDVAPGEAYTPWRRVTVVGPQRAYRIGANGTLLGSVARTFASPSGANVSQRATLPNLPGRWLHVENGAFAGLWLSEGPATWLPGETERTAVPSTTRLTFVPGSHTGYRFAADGSVTSSRSASLGAASGANVTARAIIRGRPHWHVVNGIWAGYWIGESSNAYRAGMVAEQLFGDPPRIALAAGTYTGHRYDSAGRRTGSVTATLPAASGANVAGWAVINGRAHWRVANGIWASHWLPAESRVALTPG